ncbi:MAG TPA: c-type cytochrome [Bryobacteraceae bacterium]|jgi:putative heme-binding domain-containing protein
MRSRIAIFAIACLATSLYGQNPGADRSTIDPVKIDTGARIYVSLCVTCHGPDGAAIGGVDLRRGQYRRAASDMDLMNAILHGVPGTAMPANALPNGDLLAVVAYLHAMKDYGARAVQLGNAEKGKAIFEGKGGCLNCHRVSNQGSHLAPDLSDIGAVHSAAMLEDTLLDPDRTAQPGNRTIRAVTKSGKIVTGRHLNEDTWTVQIIDDHEHLVSLWKPDLAEYTILKSPMPSYKDKLTASERADLVAYLVSLRPPTAGRGHAE